MLLPLQLLNLLSGVVAPLQVATADKTLNILADSDLLILRDDTSLNVQEDTELEVR